MILQVYLLPLIIGFTTQVRSNFLFGYSDDYYNPLSYYEDSNATENSTPECNVVPVCSVASNSSTIANETCKTFIKCYEYKEFPENLPTKAKMLTIQDSFFTNLTFESMKNLTELIELAIEFNDIEHIEPNTFQAQKALQILRMHGNYLHEICNGTFQGLFSLISLDLSNNRIKTVVDGSFSGLRSLKNLVLNLNSVSYLDNYLFRDLFALEDLVLQENLISYISPFAFKNLVNLKTLNLKHNLITEIPTNALKELYSIVTLFLGENPITSIQRNHLEGLRSLQNLWLERCNISKITKRAFHDKNLHILVLEGNKLARFPNLGRMKQLRVLNLDNNPWRCDRKAIPMLSWLLRHDMIDMVVICDSPAEKQGKNLLLYSPKELSLNSVVRNTTQGSRISSISNIFTSKAITSNYIEKYSDDTKTFPNLWLTSFTTFAFLKKSSAITPATTADALHSTSKSVMSRTSNSIKDFAESSDENSADNVKTMSTIPTNIASTTNHMMIQSNENELPSESINIVLVASLVSSTAIVVFVLLCCITCKIKSAQLTSHSSNGDRLVELKEHTNNSGLIDLNINCQRPAHQYQNGCVVNVRSNDYNASKDDLQSSRNNSIDAAAATTATENSLNDLNQDLTNTKGT